MPSGKKIIYSEIRNQSLTRVKTKFNFDKVKGRSTIPSKAFERQKKKDRVIQIGATFAKFISKTLHVIPGVGGGLSCGAEKLITLGSDLAGYLFNEIDPAIKIEVDEFYKRLDQGNLDTNKLVFLCKKLEGCLREDKFSTDQKMQYVPILAKIYPYCFQQINAQNNVLQQVLNTTQNHTQQINGLSTSLQALSVVAQQHEKNFENICQSLNEHSEKLVILSEFQTTIAEGLTAVDTELQNLASQQNQQGEICQILLQEYLKIDIQGFENDSNIKNLFDQYNQVCSSSYSTTKVKITAKKSLEKALITERQSRENFDKRVENIAQVGLFITSMMDRAGYSKTADAMSNLFLAGKSLVLGFGALAGYGTLASATGPYGAFLIGQQIFQGCQYLYFCYQSKNELPDDPYEILSKQIIKLSEYVLQLESKIEEKFKQVDQKLSLIFHELAILHRDNLVNKEKLKDLERRFNESELYYSNRFNQVTADIIQLEIKTQKDLEELYFYEFLQRCERIQYLLSSCAGNLETASYQGAFSELATSVSFAAQPSSILKNKVNCESPIEIIKNLNNLDISTVINNLNILKILIEKFSNQKIDLLPNFLVWRQSSLLLVGLVSAILETKPAFNIPLLHLKTLKESIDFGKKFERFFYFCQKSDFIIHLITNYKNSIMNVIKALQESIKQQEYKKTEELVEKMNTVRQQERDYFESWVKIHSPYLTHCTLDCFAHYSKDDSVGITRGAISSFSRGIILPITISYEILTFGNPLERMVYGLFKTSEEIRQEREKKNIVFYFDPTKKITSGYYKKTIDHEALVQAKRQYLERQNNKIEKQLDRAISILSEPVSTDVFGFHFFEKSELPYHGLTTQFLYPNPLSKNKSIASSKLILPLSRYMYGKRVLTYVDRLLELIGNRKILFLYDIDDKEEKLVISYVFLSEDQSYYSLIQSENKKSLDFFSRQYSFEKFSMTYMPDFFTLNEKIWWFWMGGNYPRDFVAEILSDEAFITTPSYSENMGFIDALTLSHEKACPEACEILYLDPNLKSEKIEAYAQFIQPFVGGLQRFYSKLQFGNKNSIAESFKKFRQELNKIIKVELNDYTTPLGKAIKDLDASYRILQSFLLLVIPSAELLWQKMILKNYEDMIAFLNNYQGEETYLQHLLENMLLLIDEMQIFILQSLQTNKAPFGVFADVIETTEFLSQVYESINTPEVELPVSEVEKKSTAPKKDNILGSNFSFFSKAHQENSTVLIAFEDCIANLNSASPDFMKIDVLLKMMNSRNKSQIKDCFLKLLNNEDGMLRAEVFKALVKFKNDEQVMEALLEGVNDRYQLAQIKAIGSLVILDQDKINTQIIKTLFGLLESEIHWIAQQAAAELVNLGFYEYPKIKLILEVGCDFPDVYISRHAKEFLKKLHEKNSYVFIEDTETKVAVEDKRSTDFWDGFFKAVCKVLVPISSFQSNDPEKAFEARY